jgi:hypothetical protein
MKVVNIGKGLCRIIVRSETKREMLAKIQDVIVDDKRVIFPEWLINNIKMILEPKKRKKKEEPVQTELFS